MRRVGVYAGGMREQLWGGERGWEGAKSQYGAVSGVSACGGGGRGGESRGTPGTSLGR